MCHCLASRGGFQKAAAARQAVLPRGGRHCLTATGVDKRICKPLAAAVKQWHVPRSSFAVPRLNASRFRELVSGEQQGVTANILRGILRVVEVPYSSAVAWRNRQYDRGRKDVQRVDVPVISVGNLTLGGTGKTPMVEWLARWFLYRGVRVAIVSRGYGAKAGSSNDEA